MYLHNDEKIFLDAIKNASKGSKIQEDLIEKDYYVSLILAEIAATSELAVFKGGTSLSKAHHAINRFSEDIDIAFCDHIGASRRKKLKYNVIAPIATKLGLVITNFDKTQSDRDINNYTFAYKQLCNSSAQVVPEVRLETSMVTEAFPVVEMPIENYIATYASNIDVEKYGLQPFQMKVQSLERTFVDKVFAICDYYLAGKTRRLSRHLYDLHKLYPQISFNDDLKKLIQQVRSVRAATDSCPSAMPGIDINELLKEICEKDFFKKDYDGVTQFFVFDNVKYKEAKSTLEQIAEKFSD